VASKPQRGHIVAEALIETLKALAKDDRIAGVVLRVNSPGELLACNLVSCRGLTCEYKGHLYTLHQHCPIHMSVPSRQSRSCSPAFVSTMHGQSAADTCRWGRPPQ
jgi:hypothetical protein